jgi:hypothetical protein
MPDITPLLYWVKEREAIRKRKLNTARVPIAMETTERMLREGTRPLIAPQWTTDPILAQYRFCNVRRRDDRVSKWLRRNVLTEYHVTLNLRSFLQFSSWCRWCNWPPTIAAVMDAGFYPARNIDWRSVGDFIDNRLTGKVWTGAYMIRAGKTGQGKGNFVCNEVVLPDETLDILLHAFKRHWSKQKVWETVQEAPNWGSFMAGQVVDDWSWTSLLALAPDQYTWAPMGPGSIRGYNRLMGLPVRERPDPVVWLEKLREWRNAIIQELGEEYAILTLMDVQNCLCEVDKYLRVKNQEGRPRATYKPETAYE